MRGDPGASSSVRRQPSAAARLVGEDERMDIVTSEGTFTADIAGPVDGPTVLLLHGFPQSRHTWRSTLPVLADAGDRAVAIDQRGYSPGVRPIEVEAYATDRLVADVLDVLDVLQVER